MLIFVLIFLGIFAIVALPLIAFSPSNRSKQAIATLDSAIRTEGQLIRPLKINFRKNELVSSIPWLNKKLADFELTPYLRRLLSQADLSWSPGRLMILCAAFFFLPAYTLYQYYPNILAALGLGILLGIAPFGFVLFKRGRRFNSFVKGLPEALDLMVSGLRAGNSLLAAMALVARECGEPVGTEFKVCFEEQNYGLEMKEALENLVIRVPIQDLKMVCTAIMIQKESGGNLAEVLDKTSYIIRDRFRLKRQIMVHTAQGRLTGLILSLLPVVLGIGIYFVDPGMISILWHRKIGIEMLWGAAGLTLLGGVVIWKIVDIDV
jgi:tight adherence protein B